MSSPTLHFPSQKTTHRNPSGFALVLILIVLALVAVTATFFLAAAGRERRAAEVYAESGKVHGFSDMAVNLVIGLINAATRETVAVGQIRSWASQPGMIRTFNQNGNLSKTYKLYSWDNLQSAGAYDPFAAGNVPPTDWATKPAFFTDLNAPAQGVYPILDPAALTANVEGFAVTTNGVGAGPNNIPMPVKWLYILQDGSYATATGNGTTQGTVLGATVDNPIVGRIAFWTDDETSKVNINTASEGSYWDWPKSATRDEMQFAGNPPVRNEYSRIPGHPAMTSLSPVFPELDPGDRWQNVSNYQTKLGVLQNLAPRLREGGSKGGTLPISSYTFDYSPAWKSVTTPPRITLDTERLYATSEELLFAPDRSENGVVASTVGKGSFAKRQFFLTANSRAPETTLFETPRISLWPITWPWRSSYYNRRILPPPASILSPDTALLKQNPWMIPEEKLIGFASTLNYGTANESRYFFQRQNPDSPTHDWDNIERNRELVAYLQELTNLSIPGFGGAFASKTGFDRDSVLVKIMDYSRSLINQYTTFANPLYSFTGVMFRASSNASNSDLYYEPQAYSVVPLQALGESGLGAFPKLKEVALMFYATQRREPTYTGPNAPERRDDPRNWKHLIRVDGTNTLSQTTEMRSVMLLDFTQIDAAKLRAGATFWVKITGPTFEVNGTAINLPSAGANSAQASWFIGHDVLIPWYAWAYERWIYNNATPLPAPAPKDFSNAGVDPNRWVFISDPIPMNPDTKSFSFNGSEITIELYGIDSADLDRVTTHDASMRYASYTIDFRAWNGNHATPIAPRWHNYDFDSSAPLVPNPGFNDGDGNTTKYRWAGTEIAPLASFSSIEANLSALAVGSKIMEGGWQPTYVFSLSSDIQKRLQASMPKSADEAENNPNAAPNASLEITALNPKVGPKININPYRNNWLQAFFSAFPLVTPYDTVLGMTVNPSALLGGGDPRLLSSSSRFIRVDAICPGMPKDVVSRDVTDSICAPRENRQYHTLGSNFVVQCGTGYQPAQSLVSSPMGRYGSMPSGNSIVGMLGNRTDFRNRLRPFSFTTTLASTASGSIGDWTSMPGATQDGGIVTRPDQEFQSIWDDYSDTNAAQTPYFASYGTYESITDNYFSPNRQVPSPVLLGSLPSSKTQGWQTLAFSPNPAVGNTHPGLNGPKDHLLLDFFWMPVCEPYPISDQVSTAGKINLNYQIVPFTYIERKTGLHAAMKSTWITALPNTTATDYKSPFFMRTNHSTTKSRHKINVAETLRRCDTGIFSQGDIFRSASQLCEMWMVPEGSTAANVQAFWNDKQMTSDNAREEPYNHLYSRVTTKSNTFTVHWKVQSLRKSISSGADNWDEGRDQVLAELRGSTLIERYIDPNATNIPDYAADVTKITTEPLSNFYKWRVVTNTQFNP